ncbi:MAG: oxidoreductase [Parvibaculum sp.]|jgi:NADP-dependent 3-hydroxy acid dehydrogenase YdfG|nr:oxidoreductase [Parvibaculum sp.]|tara:strand:- start:308 stop:1027 length:720 start_codon:yes stop_codon:yes gene_type:complete
MKRTAIVTGASSGIGEATCRSLVKNGYQVMMAARRTDRLEKVAAELGDAAAFHATDVANRDDLKALVAATNERFGQTDILINNAGVMPLSFFQASRVDEWEQMIDVNLKGVLYGIDAVLPQMVERRDGHIINISSVAGLNARPSSGVYAATKFGVRAISDGLRQEMTSQNVRVTVICPGGVKTELGDSIKDEAVREAAKTLFNFEFLEPENIADAILYSLNQPPSVCVGEIVIRPTEQA